MCPSGLKLLEILISSKLLIRCKEEGLSIEVLVPMLESTWTLCCRINTLEECKVWDRPLIGTWEILLFLDKAIWCRVTWWEGRCQWWVLQVTRQTSWVDNNLNSMEVGCPRIWVCFLEWDKDRLVEIWKTSIEELLTKKTSTESQE